MNDGAKTSGAVALAAGGIASAFALAACCAIPFFLASVGLGAAWLAPIVSVSQPHATALTVASLIALVGSVVLVWMALGTCAPGSICSRPVFRWTVTGVAGLGFILLVLSKVYA
jgi:mercuric ion transport protein